MENDPNQVSPEEMDRVHQHRELVMNDHAHDSSSLRRLPPTERFENKLRDAAILLDTKLSGAQIRLQREHPALWDVLSKRYEGDLGLKMKGLVRDVVYDQLRAQTVQCDLINLVNTLVPAALKLVNILLPLLV